MWAINQWGEAVNLDHAYLIDRRGADSTIITTHITEGEIDLAHYNATSDAAAELEKIMAALKNGDKAYRVSRGEYGWKDG